MTGTDTLTVAKLDRLPADEAAALLRACCGSARWVDAMIARRPFRTSAAILATADEVWRGLAPDDWLEAFAHHPRLGESRSAAPQDERARAWSGGEQAGVHAAASDVRAQLAEANAAYEERFGFICIICAAGRSAPELLEITRDRLDNSPERELRIAAEEQRRIMRLRLEKLVHDSSLSADA